MSDRKCLRFFYDAFENGIEPHADHLGKNEGIFMVEGAELFKRDIPSAELHLPDTGHFALEEEVDRIGSLIHEFLERTMNKKYVLKQRCQDFGSSPLGMKWKDPELKVRGLTKSDLTVIAAPH